MLDYLSVAKYNKTKNSFMASGIYPFNLRVSLPEDFGPARVSFILRRSGRVTLGATVNL